MAKCDTTPAPEFTIPKDKTTKEKLLQAIGYEEMEISITDTEGNKKTITVMGEEA